MDIRFDTTEKRKPTAYDVADCIDVVIYMVMIISPSRYTSSNFIQLIASGSNEGPSNKNSSIIRKHGTNHG